MTTDLRFGGNLGGRFLRTGRPTGQTKTEANLVKQDQRGPESLEEETESTPQRIRTSNLRFRRPMLYPIELQVRSDCETQSFRSDNISVPTFIVKCCPELECSPAIFSKE